MDDIKDILSVNYDLPEYEPIVLIRESSDNRVYSVGAESKKILRISKRLRLEDIAFEYEATEHLKRGAVPVATWIATKTGGFYTIIDGSAVVLFEFISGHHIQISPDHLPTSEQAFNAGKALGIMSTAAASFKTSASRARTIFSELERVVASSDIFIKEFEGGTEFVGQVKEMIAFAKSHNEIEGFIHNDYRAHNILFNDSNELVGILDFDWSCFGPLVKDLALALMEWSFPDGAPGLNKQVFNSFLEGYNSVAAFKQDNNERLIAWIRFAALSDAATYFCDLADDPSSTKRIIKSYMYRKYLHFSDIEQR